MKKLLLPAVFLLSVSQAHAGPFDGTYLPQGEADNGATCQSLSGMFDGKTPYRIQDGWIEYMESGCELSNENRLLGNDYVYTANCAAEGDEYKETIRIAPFDDKSGISITGPNWKEKWKLCQPHQTPIGTNAILEFHKRYAEALVEQQTSYWEIEDLVDTMIDNDLFDAIDRSYYVTTRFLPIDRVSSEQLASDELRQCLERQANDLGTLSGRLQDMAGNILETGFPGAVVVQERLESLFRDDRDSFLEMMILGRNGVVNCVAFAGMK